MILKDILKDIKIDEIDQSLQKFYSSQKLKLDIALYQELLEKLKETPDQKPDNNITLHVEYTEDFGSKVFIWTVSYSLSKRYKNKYSLEFIDLTQIANAYIREEEIQSKEDYVTHILWELLYSQDSEEEEVGYKAEEKRRRQTKNTEYYSKEEVLESMDDEVFDD